jgi:hypothetical protein
MQTQGNKLFLNVKTCWILMLEPTKWVMNEYRILVVKMALDFANNSSTGMNLSYYVILKPYMG